MGTHTHIHYHVKPSSKFDEILAALQSIFEKVNSMSVEIDTAIAQLQSDVATLTTVDASAVALISGFSAQLAAAVAAAQSAGATPAELQSLTDLGTAITAQSAALAAAVTAGTAPAPVA